MTNFPAEAIGRLWRRVALTDTCWLWTGCLQTTGRGQIQINGRLWQVHRVVWTLINGDIPPGLNVLHHCDVGHCVRPDHLFLGTQRDNVHDMYAKGREVRVYLKGEKNGQAKLTHAQVEQIRQRVATKQETKAAIAREFGVTEGAVRLIAKGKRWGSNDARPRTRKPRVRPRDQIAL